MGLSVWRTDQAGPFETCVFRGRTRPAEPVVTADRWFLSGCYRKAESVVSVDALVVNLLDVDALVVGVGVEVGRGRNGSADWGQGGPVRTRGGSRTER